MADSSLIGVVIGGLIGIAGGVIGPLVLELRKQAAEKKKKRGEKLEELASALYDHQHWLREMTVSAAHETWEMILTKAPPQSFSKMEAISIVYFPELRDFITSFSTISAEYVHLLEHDAEQANKVIARCTEAASLLEKRIYAIAKREFQ